MGKKSLVLGICVLMTASLLTIIPTNVKADETPSLCVGVDNNVNYGQYIYLYIDGTLYESEYVEAWGYQSEYFSQNWGLTHGWGTYFVEVKGADGNSNSEYVTITEDNPKVWIELSIKEPTPSNAKLKINQEDIAILNVNGNEVSQITFGKTIIFKFTIHNIESEDSDHTDFEIWVCCGSPTGSKIPPFEPETLTDKGNTIFGEASWAILKTFSAGVVSANSEKELTVTWKTDEIIGTSVFYATHGTYFFKIYYYPTDIGIDETEKNSGWADSDNITLIEPSKPEPKGFIPSFEAVYLLAIIGVCAVLLKGRKKKGMVR